MINDNLRIHSLISLNLSGPKLSIVVELVLTYAPFCNRNKSVKSLTIKGEKHLSFFIAFNDVLKSN